MAIPEGFPGQKLIVLPRPIVREALGRVGTRHVMVTDCGYFPDAVSHGITREAGTPQTIVILCVKGSGWCEYQGTRHPVHAGQVIVIPAGEPHAYAALPDDPWTIWWLHVTGPEITELVRSGPASSRMAVRELNDPYRAVGLIQEVVGLLERDLASSTLLAASAAAWHLLALLAAETRAPGVDDSPIDRAREYLREHLADRISVAELAALAHMSPSHFAASFRAQVGEPVLRYQTGLRMARARELLDLSSRAIADIAHEVGYPDPFYFTRQFTAVHGVTPRQFRSGDRGPLSD
ncbi:MAG TPA: AraC family transcriptional regulator [Candidatus Lumbricidophila sp.]|nr:AraC family transcriptional regulator [Candidatus Lumbricidophila sp.]